MLVYNFCGLSFNFSFFLYFILCTLCTMRILNKIKTNKDCLLACLLTSTELMLMLSCRIEKRQRLLVACEDGWLYVFSIEALASGSECTLLHRHRSVCPVVHSPCPAQCTASNDIDSVVVVAAAT